MQVICSNSAIALTQGRGCGHCQPHDSDPEAGCESVGVCIACGRPGGSCKPIEPVDFMAKYDEDRRDAAALMTDDELRRVKAELDATVEANSGYETYGHVASCDCAMDDLVFIDAEIERRGALLSIVATQP